MGITLNAYSISDQDSQSELYYRGNNGGIDSECKGMTYNVMGSINSESPTPIKIEILDPTGKVVGIYEDTLKGGFNVLVDVDYQMDGQYRILFHYKGEIYEEDYGWNKDYLPSRDAQIQCLVAKEINKSSEFNYQEITIGRDYGDTWRNYGNIEILTNILGQEKFDEIEPIFSIDSIVEQRQGEYRIETDFAIEQAEFVRDSLQKYTKQSFADIFEIKKNIISKMELTTQEKVDTIYDIQLNVEEGLKGATYRNDKFIDQVIFLYRDLDRRDVSRAQSEQIELEKKLEEQKAKQKILDEIEQSKAEIREELDDEINNKSLKTGKEIQKSIAQFVDPKKDPQYYIDRYNNEPTYRDWFHENYPEYDSIKQAVGLELKNKIPDWIKNIFLWYGQDQVSEDELLNAIKYMINEKILIVN